MFTKHLSKEQKAVFTVVRIMSTLIGLMAAVGILRASGFLDFISGLLENFTGRIGFPGELVPLTIVKMFSSSAATGLLLDIFKQFGTDSRLGMIASISLSCTETIFYTMSVYFMTAGIKNPATRSPVRLSLHSRDLPQASSSHNLSSI